MRCVCMSPAAPGARTGRIPTKLRVVPLQLQEIFHIVRNWLEKRSCDEMHVLGTATEQCFSHQLTDRSAHTPLARCCGETGAAWHGLSYIKIARDKYGIN